MNDLNHLLDRAAGPAGPGPVDVRGDLARGHRALARTRRRRGALGMAGVAALGLVGVVAVDQLGSRPGPTVAHEQTGGHRSAGLVLLSQPLDAGPYAFATTPAGWAVQGVSPSAVTIAPTDGSVDDDKDSFIGKLVIMFDQEGDQGGTAVTYAGRQFQVRGSDGYTTISTATLPGEPQGMVRIQFPDHAGWSQDTMLEFLSSVQVGPGAQPGVG